MLYTRYGINVTLVENKFHDIEVYVNNEPFGLWDKSYFDEDFADMKQCKTIKDFLFNVLALDHTYYSTDILELVDTLNDFFEQRRTRGNPFSIRRRNRKENRKRRVV